MEWTRWLRDVGMADVALVGGKNASLGEMLRELAPLGVRVPDGFAVTAEAYRAFVREAGIEGSIREALAGMKVRDVDDVARRAARVREFIAGAPLPTALETAIATSYRALSQQSGQEATDVAVRSSATAEDLPDASFAGAQETYLNVRGAPFVIEAVKKAFASLFTPRAITYREDMGFDHLAVALSVGIQKMVRSDRASAGVIFTLDPESGHRGFVLVTASLGLGESVVQGRVAPDQFYVHKQTLREGFAPLVGKKLGTKETRLIYDEGGGRQVKIEPVPEAERASASPTTTC